MSQLKQLFEQSLKEYRGDKASLLSLNDFVARLQQELPSYFSDWLNPDYTGQVALGPIAKIVIEADASAYVYTSLYNEKKACMVAEAPSPDIADWGLLELFKEAPALVVQFLALCYEQALPAVCRTDEFLGLPRCEKITFSIAEHSGWEHKKLYVYKGERHEIDYGNIRLKQLRKATSCFTEPATVERKFMEHLTTIDVQKCAAEFTPVFEKFLHWLAQQNTGPLEAITIGWSSDFGKAAGIGGFNENAYRWPEPLDIYKWFSSKRPENMDYENEDDDDDAYDMSKVRYCVSNKIAEIACLTAERIAETDIFKAIPKQDNFIMEVMNRTAGASPVFYPFDANEDDY